MLIETLARLAHEAGAERISLEIPPSDGGSVKVLVVTSFGQGVRIADDKKARTLFPALAQPLVVGGNIAEMDSRVVRLVDELEGDVIAAAKTMPETDAQKRRKELKEAAAQPAQDGDGKAAPKAKARRTKPDKTEGAATPADTRAETGSGEDHAAALATGEAESL